MKKALLLLAGLGIGFVLGSRAGRSKYEEIRGRTAEVWASDPVQKVAESAVAFVEDKSPTVGGVVSDVKSAVDDAAAAVPDDTERSNS